VSPFKGGCGQGCHQNYLKKKFITVLTFMGKLNAFLQPRFPMMVERLILGNLNKFEERYK
jgi:hypothetical protein